GRAGLTGECATDHADEARVGRDLRGNRACLVRVTLGVELDHLDGAVLVLLFELLERHLGAVPRGEHDAGVTAGQRAHEPDLALTGGATRSAATRCTAGG